MKVRINDMKEWQAEEDLHALMRAKEIRADKKRMAAVKALAQSKLMSLASMAGEGQEDDD